MNRLTWYLTAALVALPLPALASPPCECEEHWVIPISGSTGVPINTRITVSDGRVNRTDIRLFRKDGTGADVPIHIEDIVAGGPFLVVPDQVLEADTEYEAGSSNGGVLTRFTTGTSSDTAPPTFQSASITGGSVPGACDTNIAAMVSLEELADDTSPADHLTIRVDLASPARTLLLSPSYPYLGRMVADDWLHCLNNVPDAETGRSYDATITVLDWAGNASAKKPSRFEFIEGGSSCGCVVAGGPAPSGLGAAAAAIAAAVVLRRRRSRPRP